MLLEGKRLISALRCNYFMHKYTVQAEVNLSVLSFVIWGLLPEDEWGVGRSNERQVICTSES